MLDDRFDLTDHASGNEVEVPAEVMAVVRRADDLLQGILAGIDDPSLHVSWCRFQLTGEYGWTVNLDIYTPRFGQGVQLRVDDLRDPKRAKELVSDAVWEFSRGLSKFVGADLRKLRSDLKEMLVAAGV